MEALAYAAVYEVLLGAAKVAAFCLFSLACLTAAEKAPVNSFEFQSCDRTPQAGYLLR